MDFKNEFSKELLIAYENYIRKEGIPDSISNFLEFLIDHNFIDRTTQTSFLIVKAYEDTMKDNKHRRALVFEQIAQDFNLNESSIRNTLKKYSEKFKE